MGRKGIKKLNLNDLVMPDDFIFNNLDINNNLKVEGKTTLADISANDASFNNVDISSNLKVEGKTTLADLSANNTSLKNTDISGTLFVKERTTLTDLSANRVSLIITDINQTLNVIGKTTLTDLSANNASFNNVDVSNNLTITGNTTMKGDLDIEGDIKVNTINYNTENINIKYSNTIINDNIITLGLDASKNDLSYDTGFIFIDNSSNALNKTLYWSQSEKAFIFGKTDSSGVTIDNASLSVNTQGLANLKINDLSANNVSLKNTDISGTLIVKDKTTLRDLSANNTSLKNTDISGTLIVKDKTTLRDLSANNTSLKNTDISGTLIVKDKTTLHDLSANDTSLKNTDISGTLIVKDKTILRDLSANNTSLKNTDISGTLIVTGKTTLTDLSANDTSLKNTDISGTLIVKSKTTLRDLSANNTSLKNTDISGTLDVKDKTTLRDLSANNTSLKNTDISGTLDVKDKTTLRDLSANDTSLKNTDISGTLDVKDKTTLRDLSANDTSLKNTDISGTLDVKDKTTLRDLSANDTSLKNTDISGTLDVKDKTTLRDLSANDVSFNNVDTKGTLIVTGKTTLTDLSANDVSFNNVDTKGTLIVTGKTTLTDLSANDVSFNNVDTKGTLIVTGKTTLRDLSANDVSFNNVDTKGTLIVTGKTTLTDLSANDVSFNNVDTKGTLIVTGKTTLTDLSANDVSFNNVDTKGTLIVTGKTTLTDLSANDVSFNNVDTKGTLIVTGKTTLRDLSANDVSFNNIRFFGKLLDQYGREYLDTEMRTAENNIYNLDISMNSAETRINNLEKKTDISSSNIDISENLLVKGKTTLADLSANDVSFNNIQFFGKLLDQSGNEFQSGSGGSGIDISGSSTGMLINEGKIIYDTSQNSFYEAVTLPTNTEPPTSVVFRELGYSFFKKNFEGSPPAPSFFFLINDITSVSITLRWKNPYQYPSGVSNNNDSYLNTNASTINDQYNIYFPVVNRIMIQIKNLETNEYHKWGNFTSNTSVDIVDLSSARCICSKHYPIPPYTNSLSAIQPTASRTDIFNASLNNGRTNAVYKLDEFADSITLYSNNNSPSEADIATLRQESDKIKRIYPGGDMESKELSASKDGYEILLWLENQYIKKDSNNNNIMTKDDFNIVDIRDQNGQYINFLKGNPPSEPLENEVKLVFSDNIGTNIITDVSENNTFIELKIKDPSFSTTTPSLSNEDLNKIIKFSAIKFEYSNTDLAISNNWVPCKKIFITNGVKNTFTDLNSNNQEITLDISGVWSVDSNPIKFTPRYNDNSINTISSIYHYYYVKLDDAFLDVSNNEMEQYHKFRVSYKNGSQNDPELFGGEKESSTIQITEPPQPTLSSVKMTKFNELTIKLKDMSANKIDSSNNPLDSNNNRAVFLRDISFNITQQYGGDSLPSQVTNISGLKGNWDTNNINTTYNTSNPILISSRKEGQDTDYIFTLPPGYLDPLKITDLSYNFNAQVKNNINNKWSVSSDISSIQITKT